MQFERVLSDKKAVIMNSQSRKGTDNMRKIFVFVFAILMLYVFSVSSFSYYMSPKDVYGEPEKSYDEGYEDGFEDAGGRIVYKTREVSAEKYIADHETRFRELYITFLLVIGICVVPMIVFRYGIIKASVADSTAAAVSVVYNLIASAAIAYIMYRIDYLVPCLSIVVLWGIICKKILAS